MDNLDYEKIYSMCETYQTTPDKNGKGTFFFTDCGNEMYSVCGELFYHKKLCPKCRKTLLLRGTKDGIDYMDWKQVKSQQSKKIDEIAITQKVYYQSR